MVWWVNCGTTDRETAELDRVEATLAPLTENVRQTRALISRIEMCHYKADRWVERIIDAIGSGRPSGGLGSRASDQRHMRRRLRDVTPCLRPDPLGTEFGLSLTLDLARRGQK